MRPRPTEVVDRERVAPPMHHHAPPRRTVYMHDDWVWHRSSDRFLRNMKSIGSSGINQALRKELTFVTLDAVRVTASSLGGHTPSRAICSSSHMAKAA